MTANSVRVILVEDNPGDARFILEMLKESKNVKFEISNTKRLDESLKLLDERDFEVILLGPWVTGQSGARYLKNGQFACSGITDSCSYWIGR